MLRGHPMPPLEALPMTRPPLSLPSPTSTRARTLAAILALALTAPAAAAQTFPTADPVIKAIWAQGMGETSRVEPLAQALLDSIGPRLTGSPANRRAQDWLLGLYARWGVQARREDYGTWLGWDRDYSHIDLVAPRKRTLNGMMMAWSPGTDAAVEGPVVALPELASSAELAAWLPSAKGKFVALTHAEPTCRAPESWAALATPESRDRMTKLQQETRDRWQASIRAAGGEAAVVAGIEQAGALGVLTGNWSAGWGANKIFDAPTRTIPSVHLSCEDYGLVHRLASRNQGPRLRLDARSEFQGEVPMSNILAVLPGKELPDEYVLLTAHYDSEDGASGATDNGSGTIMMLEAMRILKQVYPNPRRTIMAAHWGAEELGLVGSGAFAEDHPEILKGLQAAFNQDNGTWRIDFIRMQGFAGAGASFGRWFGKIPDEITRHIELDIPGEPERGGSDHMSFICRGVPGFRLQADYPDYRQYTWHTDLDTYDKLVLDDLRSNATLAAMLAYLASEDPERVSNEQITLPEGQTWPQCGQVPRSSAGRR
jgi:carboxypeptidase Q